MFVRRLPAIFRKTSRIDSRPVFSLARHVRNRGDHELTFGAVDTVSSVFLGMTVACAKCHDHFFDSIAQQEYYQMKALFDGLALHKETLATDEEKVRNEKVLELWEAKKKAIQVRLDEFTDPYYPARYEERLKLLPPQVEAIYRLKDLKQRGLLDTTLVVLANEFGRTPWSQNTIGRDQNPHGFSVWISGGGVCGGIVYGATDDIGLKAVESPHDVGDLQATILQQLGLDYEEKEVEVNGAPHKVIEACERPIEAILA